MKRIVLLLLFISFSPLYAQDGRLYLDKAYQYLEQGDIVNAEKAYGVYNQFKKTDTAFEELLYKAKQQAGIINTTSIKYANGQYIGNTVNGVREGKGTYIWPNGARYEGDWKNDQRTGKGIYTWPNGEQYEGDFINGYMHGQGTYRWPNGDVYKGEFINDEITGSGIIIWSDGTKYVGEFSNGEMQGHGTYYYTDGRKKAGLWRHNKYIAQ